MMVLKRLVFVFGLLLLYFILGLSTARAEITVYDNDGQYLGILERVGCGYSWSACVGYCYIKIYVPSTNMFYALDNLDNPDYCDLEVGVEYFETTDCTGTSYLAFYPRRPTYPFVSQTCAGTYRALGEAKVITIRSEKDAHTCECSTRHSPVTDTATEWVPAPPPPFTLPVSLPFRYEHSTLGVEKVVIGPPQ